MGQMELEHGPLICWDVKNVVDMWGMFQDAPEFNQDLSAWKVESVTNMNFMFSGAYAFNQELCWDVADKTTDFMMDTYSCIPSDCCSECKNEWPTDYIC